MNNLSKKQFKKFKSVIKPAVLFLALLLVAFATGCSGGPVSNVKDAFSSSNDAVDTGIDDGTDAIETGAEDSADAVNDGTDAVSDAADDVADEFQNVTTIVSVTVTPSTASVKIGGKQQYSATATYQNGSSLSVSASAVWTSGTTSKATMNEATRTATGVAVGTTEIKASFLGKSGTSILTVTSN